MKVEEIEETGINLNSVKKVCFEYANKQSKKNFVEVNDVLITTVGTIGKVCVVTERIKAILSRDIAKIKLSKTSPISPFYLQAFLMSKNAQILLEQISTGGLQQGLYLYQIKQLKIPIPSDAFQKFIEKLVLKAYEERQKAEQLYKQAEEILLEELGLKDWKPRTKKIKIGGKDFEEEENISIRMLSEVLKADRMDAEYWEPKYDDIEKTISNYKNGYRLIRELLLDAIKNGTTPKNLIKFYDRNEHPFVRVDAFGPFLNTKEKDLYSIDKETLKKLNYCSVVNGDILVSITGTIGEAVIYTLNKTGAINQNIVRLRPNKNLINSEVLALYIKVVGKLFLQKLQTGNVQPYVNTINFSKLIVPLIEPQTQQKISQLIQQSFKARENSKKLLEIAKRTVEIYIEKDEEEGMKYANSQLEELNIKVD